MKKIKYMLVLLIFVIFMSGCVTTKQKDEASVLSKEEIIDMKLKQTLAISETSLEISKNAEVLAKDALEKSKHSEDVGAKALAAANEAIKAANESRKFAEQETEKAIKAANESRTFAKQESEKAISAANKASKMAWEYADKAAEKSISAANEAIQAANRSSEKSVAVANQTISEINRLRATIKMAPPEEPIIMDEPKIERTYVIKSGDTLSQIAKKYYGDASKWQLIYKQNQNVLKTPNNIRAGTRIIIP